jgi:hypothetical protein
MASPRQFLTGLALVVAAALAALTWQHRTTAALHRELAQRQATVRERARLEEENRRLRSNQPTPEQLAVRAEERTALTKLANDLEVLRRRAAEPVAAGGSADPTPAPRPTLRDAYLPAEDWTNAGDKNAVSALETALWAAAHGDIDMLMGLLSVSETTRERAAAVLARLPAAARQDFGSPEQLVAMLTASAIPLEGARVAAQFDDTPQTARLVLELTSADGRMRERVISAHFTPDGWRLTVPDGEIQRYFVALQKPAGP